MLYTYFLFSESAFNISMEEADSDFLDGYFDLLDDDRKLIEAPKHVSYYLKSSMILTKNFRMVSNALIVARVLVPMKKQSNVHSLEMSTITWKLSALIHLSLPIRFALNVFLNSQNMTLRILILLLEMGSALLVSLNIARMFFYFVSVS